MPFIEYVPYKPMPTTVALIGQCNRILDEMTGRGYTLTLRQLYYQLVTENLIENNIKSYDRLKSIVSNARDGGLINWDHIQDRGRSVRSFPHWDDPSDFVTHVVPQFRTDRWVDQPRRVEVWVEKDALVDVVARPAQRWDVPYFATKDYISASSAWAAGRRFMHYGINGQDVVILHLGDHDPSGIDMTRDVTERTQLYSSLIAAETEEDSQQVHIEVRRLALNMDQVNELNLHPNPAKLSDSRAPDYVALFGEDSWELDAIPVDRIEDIIDHAIQDIVNMPLYTARSDRERQFRRELQTLPANWEAVQEFLNEMEQ